MYKSEILFSNYYFSTLWNSNANQQCPTFNDKLLTNKKYFSILQSSKGQNRARPTSCYVEKK